MATSPNTSLLDAAKGTQSDKTPAPLSAPANVVSWAFNKILPPSSLYIERDDKLVIQGTSVGSVDQITVNVRLLRADGTVSAMQGVLATTADQVTRTLSMDLAEGYLLSVSAKAVQSTQRGVTFCRTFLNRGAFGTGQPGQVLFADYLTQSMSSGFPNGRITDPSEGTGQLLSVSVANPAAGADWSFIALTNTRVRIVSLKAVFTASAAVANRSIGVRLIQTALQSWLGEAEANVVASSVTQVAGTALPGYATSITNYQLLPLPPALYLASTDTLQSTTGGIDVADQWSAIALAMERWLIGV